MTKTGNVSRDSLRHVMAAILLWAISCAAALAACRDDVVWIRGDFGQARFTVEIADDNAERATGLMNRTEIAASAGMLFIYERPRSLSFWMRNTLIPLDMLFIDSSGVVRSIHHEAIPLDETPIFGGDDLTHVLEINGGLAKQLGIAVGDQLRHPSFSKADPAWAC